MNNYAVAPKQHQQVMCSILMNPREGRASLGPHGSGADQALTSLDVNNVSRKTAPSMTSIGTTSVVQSTVYLQDPMATQSQTRSITSGFFSRHVHWGQSNGSCSCQHPNSKWPQELKIKRSHDVVVFCRLGLST